MKFSKIAKWLPVMLLIIGSQNAKGIEKIVPTLESLYTVDACADANKKEILIVLKIGEVKKTDSLFGFNFEIKYDPSKIKIDNVIWQNTLSEFFDTKQATIRASDSAVFGTAGHLNPYAAPASGNLALVALYGFWMGDCPDSSAVSLSYLEFTEEFTKEVDSIRNTFVSTVIKEKPERLLAIEFSEDSLLFKEESTKDVVIEINGNGNKLSEISFILEKGNEKFNFVNLSELSQNFEITEFKDTTNGKYVKLKINQNDLHRLNLNLASSDKNSEYSDVISIKNIEVNQCDCISFKNSNTISLKSFKQDDTTSIIEGANIKIEEIYQNVISIKFDENDLKNIVVSDILGKPVYNISSYKLEEIISLEKLINGIYFIRIEKSGYNKIVKHIKY